jgi:2-polyprenyl-3-methyl-5-hydroxy-6-metoxy-1,4-benzoquinol methylase
MIEIPSMPFYWRSKPAPGVVPSDPPARVPFAFTYDPVLDLIIERRSPELTRLLADIYSRNANVGYLQDGSNMVGSYGEDFWRFLGELLDEFPAKSVLEIGCGGCVLLERARERGCEVVGVDPSPVAVEAGRRKGIEIVEDFFPVDLAHPFDLIFEVDVLEHIEDPLPFLRAQADCLTDRGLIVVNVPDNSPSIARGDLSMALHQHVNMFDTVSLPATLRAAGLEIVKLERSRYGSSLYCAARRAAQAVPPVADPERWAAFESRARSSIARWEGAVAAARSRGETVGFFIPQRAFPYLGLIGWFDGFRIFDNMNVWHGRYLDGCDVPVENQAELVARPVDHVFVMSLSFGKQLGAELRRDVPNMRVTTLEELLDPPAG